VPNVSGVWKGLTDNVNFMASNLTDQVRNIAQVATAVANGDLTQKITVDARGEILELKSTINTMVDQLSSFADEVTRVAREVGTEGRLGGQAQVRGVLGTWRDLTDNVNSMANNLTSQVRNIAQVTTAVARGDLTQQITVDVKGEIAELKNTINTMVDRLSSFADEVTRVAREVGTEGKLGGQARVKGVSGTWRDLTDNVNIMADSLTAQVRDIAQVTTAVARGDLTKKITVDVRGEILELKNTINTMVDQLSSFADEVTRVAREVGTEGKLGGQARVKGVSGTWKDLTDNVNIMADSLTEQVRSINEVASAVTQGDLTQSIAVEAQGEVAALKDTINQMIANLGETTRRNKEQDWLKTSLARISRIVQGQRDLQAVCQLIMSELTPTVSAQHGAFFLMNDSGEPQLQLVASYGYRPHEQDGTVFKIGESLVGQAAFERGTILVTDVPDGYVRVRSGLGAATPTTLVILPILYEDDVLGVIELAALRPFTDVNLTFLNQAIETIGVVLSTIIANTRTESLLMESQRLAQELQAQQEELRRSNVELESQNRNIEVKNREIEMARLALEEKAEQLAMSSKYKSEFLANMSHELRTPLNSLLILAKLLTENEDGNLSEQQVEFARTIYTAGTDLLDLINDILDLSKVEAGRMIIVPADVRVADICATAEESFRPVANDRGLDYRVELQPGVPETIYTDEQRLQQVLRNLLSNAFKFTERGAVQLSIGLADQGFRFSNPALAEATTVLAFSVIDTGIGIAPEKLQQVFEAFQQADGTTSRRYGGTGLGLSISREIAHLLGGELHVSSQVGSGSTFTLYLPDAHVFGELTPEGGAEVRLAEMATETPIPKLLDKPLDKPLDVLIEPVFGELHDDRDTLKLGDRALLVIEGTEGAGVLARAALDLGRERGFKVLLAPRGSAGLILARKFPPSAILLDVRLPYTDGVMLLTRFKQDADLRHIPVHVYAHGKMRQRALRAGAFGFTEQPVNREEVAAAIDAIVTSLDRATRHLLVVGDDAAERKETISLLDGEGITITCAASSAEARNVLERGTVDCVILDLRLPESERDMLLDGLAAEERLRAVPIVIATGRHPTRRERASLSKRAESLILIEARSPERLLEQVSLFLHRSWQQLRIDQQAMLQRLWSNTDSFEGKRVLIVDDDVRNVFALTSVLERQGLTVLFAENGRDGVATLKRNPDVALVLMDVMMPEMDGYQATAEIREIPQFKKLPIIALTAKAMKGDREKSIASGASDYIAKPIDVDQLLSLMRSWLSQ